MSHAGFIIASYAVTAAVMAGIATWVFFDGRAVSRRLDELAARGVRRRSASAVPRQ